MSFNRLPRWLSLTACRLFPRSYCCARQPFVHQCNCRSRNPVQLRVDMFESRESPTSLAGPNPLASSLGALSMTSLAADHTSGFADASWHSPKTETVGMQGPTVGPSVVPGSPSVVRGSPDPAPAATESLPQHSSPTTSDSWAAFSTADFFSDPVALDFPLFTQPHARNSLSVGTLDEAQVRSSPNDSGDSSSGSAAGSPVSAGSAGSLMFDPLNLGNGLSGLVGNGPANGPSLAPSPPLSSSLPPGVLPLTTPVVNAGGSDNGPLTTNHSPLTNPPTNPAPT
jgi:hypothetical protein